jgi:hypothetical protein
MGVIVGDSLTHFISSPIRKPKTQRRRRREEPRGMGRAQRGLKASYGGGLDMGRARPPSSVCRSSTWGELQWPMLRARRPPSSVRRSSAWDELGRLLGRGTFAKVYYAFSLDGDDPMAMKVLDKPQLTATGMAMRVLHEVSTMRRLCHPNMLCLHKVLTPELIIGGP